MSRVGWRSSRVCTGGDAFAGLAITPLVGSPLTFLCSEIADMFGMRGFPNVLRQPVWVILARLLDGNVAPDKSHQVIAPRDLRRFILLAPHGKPLWEGKRRIILLGQNTAASNLVCEAPIILAHSRQIFSRDKRAFRLGTGGLADSGSESHRTKICGTHANRDECCCPGEKEARLKLLFAVPVQPHLFLPGKAIVAEPWAKPCVRECHLRHTAMSILVGRKTELTPQAHTRFSWYPLYPTWPGILWPTKIERRGTGLSRSSQNTRALYHHRRPRMP